MSTGLENTDSQEINSSGISKIAQDSEFEKVVVTKPWGYEYLLFQNNFMAAWLLCLNPLSATSLHKHNKKLTRLIVIDGEVTVQKGSEISIQKKGDEIIIPKTIAHQTSNTSKAVSFIVELEYPNNKLDLQRISDNYGRETQGYEKREHYKDRRYNNNYVNSSETDELVVFSKLINKTEILFVHGNSKQIGDYLSDGSKKDFLLFILSEIESTDGTQSPILDKIDANKFISILKKVNTQNKIGILLVNTNKKQWFGHEILADTFHCIKKTGVFTSLSDANIHLINHSSRLEELQLQLHSSDLSAGFACEGYSSFTNCAGVFIVGSNYGSLEALQSIQNAWTDSTPMVVIKIDEALPPYKTHNLRQSRNKELNFANLISQSSKLYIELVNEDFPFSIHKKMEYAFNQAENGRAGPVIVSVLQQDLNKIYSFNSSDLVTISSSVKPKAIATQKTKKLVAKVQKKLIFAQKPVLVIGSGLSRLPNKSSNVEKIEMFGLPVVSTRSAIDFLPTNHSLNFGRGGSYGNRYSNKILQEADLILSIGARLGTAFTGRSIKNFNPSAQKIVVDIDADEAYKLGENIDSIVMDSAKFLDMFSTESFVSQRIEKWLSYIQYLKITHPQNGEFIPQKNMNRYPHINNAIEEFSSLLPSNATVFVDGGGFLHQATQNFKVNPEVRIINSSSLEIPGYSFAASMGAALSLLNQTKRLFAMTDDYGFSRSVSYFRSISVLRPNALYVIFSSRSNKLATRSQSYLYPNSSVGYQYSEESTAPEVLWRTWGLPTRTLKLEDSHGLKELIENFEPATLLIIEVDDNIDLFPRLGFSVNENGTWSQNSLDNMFPEVPILNFNEYLESKM
jgi:acetolactate synthase-1/2/3 large subunit